MKRCTKLMNTCKLVCSVLTSRFDAGYYINNQSNLSNYISIMIGLIPLYQNKNQNYKNTGYVIIHIPHPVIGIFFVYIVAVFYFMIGL